MSELCTCGLKHPGMRLHQRGLSYNSVSVHELQKHFVAMKKKSSQAYNKNRKNSVARLTAELEAANEKLAAARSVLELDRDSPCEWYVVGGCKVKNADGRGCNACRRREVLALLK
jgi:hypothetical protein